MPEDLVSSNPLSGYTMPDRKKEYVMSSTTAVQPRTFSWLADGFREFLSFQQTLPRNGDTPVSVLDTPQQILESGPTAALLRMKEKKETGAFISQEEWAMLAHYVQQGAEFWPNRHISHESVVGILQAFRAAYKLRKPGGDDGKADYYLKNLNTIGQYETTIEAAIETHLAHAEWPIGNGARPLVVFLRNDHVTDEATLTSALLPHWDALWRVAARGHFLVLNKPIRDKQNPDVFDAYEPVAFTATRESFVYSVFCSEGHGLSALLSFPGPTAAMYPLAGYPDICEFRAM